MPALSRRPAGVLEGLADLFTWFVRARDWARRLQTPSWELRVAISLARLQRQQGRDDEARALLLPIYRGFTEGFATLDLRTARRMVDDLG